MHWLDRREFVVPSMRVSYNAIILGVLLYLAVIILTWLLRNPAIFFPFLPLPLLIVLSTTYLPPRVVEDEERSGFGPGWPFILAAVGIPLFGNIIEFYLYILVLTFSTAAISISQRTRRNIPAPSRSWHIFWALLVMLPLGTFTSFFLMLLAG